VLAGVRRKIDDDRIRADGIEPVMLDITLPEDISALASRIAADPPRRLLRAVVNNAGVEINAPVEVVSLDL
jgi:NAD(P)-dependent dehydrogenase (short-subunit alcohol dehydrogenase family)